MKRNTFLMRILSLLLIISCYSGQSLAKDNVDVLVIGGGASGVSAGVQVARMGCKAMIIEETPWVGGMLTSAGVSAIDGNNNLPAGFWGEFKDSLTAHYGSAEALKTGWVSNVLFEPSTGNKILNDIISKEKNLGLSINTRLVSIESAKGGKWIVKVQNQSGKVSTITATTVIDATELGDVAKAVGISYDIGMESKNVTGENIAPEDANGIIQDLTYVAVLKDYGRDVTIARPAGYDSTAYACSAINDLCVNPTEPDRMWSRDMMISYGKLPNGKYMINWPIEGNDYYLNIIEMSREEREKALEEAKNFTMGFIYFIQKELGFNTLGLADDEFPTADRLPMIPYHRESRRIHGAVRFKLDDITAPYSQTQPLYRTTIAVGDYPVDHHHERYRGNEELPRLYFYPVPSFGLPLGTLIPTEVDNFIVAEKSISVSNIVNGTTRLQPVVMQIGTAAGVLASLAIKKGIKIKDVKVRDVQREILATGGYLLPYLDVTKESPLFNVYQRIGATGILRGVGKNVDWSNQTWLNTDSLLHSSQLDGLKEFYPHMSNEISTGNITVGTALEIINDIACNHGIKIADDIERPARDAWQQYNFGVFDKNKNIKRGEFALLIDHLLDPFSRDVTITGELAD